MVLTINQLTRLLDEQKLLTATKLLGLSYYYNKDSDDSNLKTLNIDPAKFNEVADKSPYPDDIRTLLKYQID